MSSSARKRKYRPAALEHIYGVTSQSNANNFINESVSDPDAVLAVQAYESDVIRGPEAQIAAKSLEVNVGENGSGSHITVGEGLIRWGGAGNNAVKKQGIVGFGGDDDESDDEPDAVWVDRYALSDRLN